MVQTPIQRLTLAEFLALPETEPASEYIDGQIIQKPMPQGKHSSIQTELSTAINAQLRPKKLPEPFQNYAVHLVIDQSFPISLFSVGTELHVIRIERSPMFFNWPQIG